MQVLGSRHPSLPVIALGLYADTPGSGVAQLAR